MTRRGNMRKRMTDNSRSDQRTWVKGRGRGVPETMRSFSAPQPVQVGAALPQPEDKAINKVATGKSRQPPGRSLSATEPSVSRSERPIYRETPREKHIDDSYNFAYLDATSPSDESDGESHRNSNIQEGLKEEESVILFPTAGVESVGPAKKVVTSLLAGSGLQRAQVRPAVKSFNTRVRDLASVMPPLRMPRTSTKSTAHAPCFPASAQSSNRRPSTSATMRWIDEDNKKTDGMMTKDSADLDDEDDVGITLHTAERQLHLPGVGLQELALGNLGAPGDAVLAVQESDDDEVAESSIGGGGVSATSDDMATIMENLKSNSRAARQAQLSQITSNQSSMSQTQVTSSTAQMVSTASVSSSRVASSRLHHLTSEMKANSMKSDLSELKNSISEMKNLSSAAANFTQRLRNSMENLVDATDPDSDIQEPLVTFPESDSPPNTAAVLQSHDMPLNPAANAASQMINSSSMEAMKFEQKRMTSASKTKVVTEGYSSEEATANSAHLQRRMAGELTYQGNTTAGARTQRMASSEQRNAFKQEQRTLKAGELTQQEGSKIAASSMKVQTDSYSSEQKAMAQQQARQTVTSSGMFSQEKHVAQSNMTITSKNMCTTSSMISAASQMSQLMNGSLKSNEEELANITFDDLNNLSSTSNPKDVEKAIQKYSALLDAFVKGLKRSQGDEASVMKAAADLNKINEIIKRAWAVPTFGHELGYELCNALRRCGGLDLLMMNCVENENKEIQFSSAQLLEQCLTTENRAHVVEKGLEKVVNVACVCTKNANSVDHSRVGTGILEHLFKHSEGTCSDVIKLGGLDAVLFECRKNDVETLRHCAGALANLSLYGGAENQEAMIKRKVPMWLFPLAFHNDDNIKYYACLAIAVLVANTEIEAAVLKSGTLDLVEPFVTSHNPSEFARSNLAHAHGQSKNWLQRLVPVLSSKREEARNLAAFHFCMEAGIKKQQGNTEIFKDIGAIEPLKKVASCPNAVASKYAAQALRLIGEELPHKLSQQVPLWSTEDVREWVKQIGFSECANNFVESRVDGDLLLQLTEDNLKQDIGLTNGIRRRRFTRELQNLKKMADYSSRDAGNLNTFLQTIGLEYSIYTYSMLNAGVDKDSMRSLNDEQLENECGINNSIHRLRILDSIRACESTFSSLSEENLDKSLDVFVSYRRSNGSQLASLLKVHLQLRGFSVFIDVERLEAGKFDMNLLQSIRQAKHFLLVLTPKALDRCIADGECKDWVHKEIVAALQSQCNIIPIIDNFAWPEPEELPEDMRQVCHFNGVRWIHDYQDACVDKLERFMRGELKEGMLGRSGLAGKEGGTNPPPTPAPMVRAPPSYQRMHSSDSGKGSSDKDQTNGSGRD